MKTHMQNGFALGAVAAIVALTGCGDLGTQPGPIAARYSLESISGQSLPLKLRDPGSAGDFVTVRSGRVVLEPGALEDDKRLLDGNRDLPEGDRPPHDSHVLHLHTTVQILRRDASGTEAVVAEGESSQAYYFDRVEGKILPYRLDGGVRTEAPFFFEVHGASLVMQSSQDALRNWRFTS